MPNMALHRNVSMLSVKIIGCQHPVSFAVRLLEVAGWDGTSNPYQRLPDCEDLGYYVVEYIHNNKSTVM